MVRALYLPIDLPEKDTSGLFADYRWHRDSGAKLGGIDRSTAVGINAFSSILDLSEFGEIR